MKQAFNSQARVIGALILRETSTRFGKTQLGYLWAIAEPIVYVVTLALLFAAVGYPPAYGDSLLLFFTTGVMPYQIFRRINTFVSSAFESNRSLFSFPVVKPVDALFARAILELATNILAMFILFAFLIFALGFAWPVRFHAVALSVLAVAAIGFGLGVLNAVIIARFDSWKNIETMLTRPLFMISGVFFVIDSLPEKVRVYLAWNPLAHAIELMRYGIYLNYRGTTLDGMYLLWWALAAPLIGLAAERAFRNNHAGATG